MKSRIRGLIVFEMYCSLDGDVKEVASAASAIPASVKSGARHPTIAPSMCVGDEVCSHRHNHENTALSLEYQNNMSAV